MKTNPLSFLATLFVILTPSYATANITSIHHTMIVRLDPQKHFLEVSDNIQIKGSGDAIFRLASNFIISNLKKDGQATSHTRQEETFRIQLGNKNHHHITLKYEGFLAEAPSIELGLSGTSLMASEKGSFLSSWSAWHPYMEDVAFSYHLKIIVPEEHKVIVPGRLIEEKTIDGFYNAVFESEIPTVGIVLIAGRFVINERHHKKILLRTYFSSELANLSDRYLESTIRHIDHFEKLIGDYPFSSFSIISGPLPVGLGFSGMAYMGERVLQLPFIRFTSLGHEVLHNWWGNGIKIDYKDGNWAEGLTTYMADYTFSGKKDAESAKRIRKEWLRDYAALPRHQDRSVRSFISKSHDASQIIGYNKAAFIFHMLSKKVGKEFFKKSIRKFWNRHKYQMASWDDIQKIFEETSGLDLKIFFQQWVNRKGAPGLIMSDVIFDAKKLSLKLSQTGLPYFLDIPIKIITKNGVEVFQRSISDKVSQIELQFSEPPKSIFIDPDFDIFRRLTPNETSPILRDITLNASSVVFLINAEMGVQKIAKKLATRMLDNPPHFVEKTQVSNLDNPMLIIGTTQTIAQFLQENNFPTTPKILQGRGSARVWTTRRLTKDGTHRPLLVVEANNAQALKDLLRPLPHYGRRSYLIFNSATVTDSGVWPAKHSPLSITLN